jgi:hypothetical protein
MKPGMFKLHRNLCPRVQVPCSYAALGCAHVCPRADLEAHHAAATTPHLQLATAKTTALEASLEAKTKALEASLGSQTKALETSFETKSKALETKTFNLERELQELRNLVVQKVGGGAGHGSAATVLVKRESTGSPDTTTGLALPYGRLPSPTNELDALRRVVDAEKSLLLGLRGDVNAVKTEVKSLRSDADGKETEIEELRNDVEEGKEEVERLCKALKLVQAACEYGTLDADWAIDPAVLRKGADLRSDSFRPCRDVKLHLSLQLRSDGVGIFFCLDNAEWVPLDMNGWSVKVWHRARY